MVAIVAIGLALWAALVAWAASSPWGSAPDDDYHTAMTYCAAGELDCVREGKRESICYALRSEVPGECDLTGELSAPPGEGIIEGWYPPMYYAVAGVFIDDTVAGTARNIRLANAALTVALVIGSVALSRPSIRLAVALSWLVASVPMGVFLFGSMSPSAWATLGVASMWGPLLSLLTMPSFRGRANLVTLVARLAFIEVAVLLSLGSRSEPPVYIGILTAAVTIIAFPWRPAEWRRRRNWIFVVPVLIGVQALTFLLTFTSAKISDRQSGAPDPLGPWEVAVDALALPARLLADPLLGWLDTPSPPLARALVAGAYFGSILIGLGVLYRRKVAGLAFYFLASWAFVALVLASASAPGQLQPRYFLPLLFGLVGIALLPVLGQRPTAPTRVQAIIIAIALGGANLLALLWNNVRYLDGLDGSPISAARVLDAATPAWWHSSPFDPGTTWLLGSSAFLAAAVGGVLLTLSVADEAES